MWEGITRRIGASDNSPRGVSTLCTHGTLAQEPIACVILISGHLLSSRNETGVVSYRGIAVAATIRNESIWCRVGMMLICQTRGIQLV